MGIYFIRALFALIFAGVGWQAGVSLHSDAMEGFWTSVKMTPPPLHWCILASVGLYLVMLAFEVGVGHVAISTISAVVFGLIVGFIIANLSYSVVSLFLTQDQEAKFGVVFRLILGAVFCYLGVATIYKTRDRFNFIIPYVEFRKEQRGPNPIVLDTSSIIDGRVADIAETGFLDVPIIIPRFVLDELQSIADSEDKLKRVRGRRGLDILNRLRHSQQVAIEIRDSHLDVRESVDARLIHLAKRIHGRIVTNDSPLEKIAQLQGVDILNINDLANALRPVFIPGEEIDIKLIKPGEGPGQAVGYLEDGTMVVIENAGNKVGSVARAVITSVLQRSSGRMIFGKAKTPVE
ncbi:MAG: PIN/TRAM domain-containing protein [Planctomycetes bacterium]|nr:PIN/TRAM domain-containing protein [Planctomycetota bacterium]